jgi:hypothetical protein
MRFYHFGLIVAIALFCGRITRTEYCSVQQSEESSVPKSEMVHPDEESPADLLFDPHNPVEILSIELEFTERGVNRLRLWKRDAGFSGKVKAETISTTDPRLLELAIHAFDYHDCYRPFRNPRGDGSWIGGDLGMPYAVLRFETKKGPRIIGLSRGGFSLGDREASQWNGFISPGGAEFVNLLFMKKNLFPLPADLLDGLSGQLQLRLASDYFQVRREATTPEEVK